jgi:chemotaxis protein histidine kinase CheA
MATNDKTDTPNSDAGNAAAKAETTASAKANARKKQQQQKNQKNAPATKKKNQQQVVRSTFEGIASGANPMKGIVIAQGNGNLFDQFRVYLNGLAGSAADDKAYGLDSAILELTPKVRSDFVKPRPNPNIHSNLTPIIENGVATGGNRLICFDPIVKE